MAVILDQVTSALEGVISGKANQIRLSLCCLLARGHLLIEDLPGMGKTTLSHALASVFGLDYKRIQFTSDLLPADIVGVSTYNRDTGAFRFQDGPVFSQLLLADEINRATPRTQSALLEAMEEQQVTVEGETRKLPDPFFVIATQNPISQAGTFALPESQLDRFLMRIHLGYPDPEAERAMLKGESGRTQLSGLKPVATLEQLQQLQDAVSDVHASDMLLDYLLRLAAASRSDDSFSEGLSPRAVLALLQASRSWAFMSERDYILPEDVQAVFPAVAGHRLPSRQGMSALQRLLSETDTTGLSK